MARGLIVREATAADVPVFLDLVRELAAYERLAHEVVATEGGVREALFGPHATAWLLLAERGAEVVGYALAFPTFSTFVGRPGVWLEDLYVRPAVRGEGIGGALLGAVASRAVASGAARLEGSVLDWNAPAREVYRAKGARPLEGWTTWRVVGEDLARLAKEVP